MGGATNGTTVVQLRETEIELLTLKDYKDSIDLAALCRKKINDIEKKAADDAEEYRITKEKEAKAKAKKRVIMLFSPIPIILLCTSSTRAFPLISFQPNALFHQRAHHGRARMLL